MNIFAWLLGLSFLILLMIEAVTFHRATVCRQKAWLKSAEILTRSKLTDALGSDQSADLPCTLYIKREKDRITWKRLPSLEEHEFPVRLKGSL